MSQTRIHGRQATYNRTSQCPSVSVAGPPVLYTGCATSPTGEPLVPRERHQSHGCTTSPAGVPPVLQVRHQSQGCGTSPVVIFVMAVILFGMAVVLFGKGDVLFMMFFFKAKIFKFGPCL